MPRIKRCWQQLWEYQHTPGVGNTHTQAHTPAQILRTRQSNIYEKRNFLYVKKDLRLSRMDNGKDAYTHPYSDCEKSRNRLHSPSKSRADSICTYPRDCAGRLSLELFVPLIGINVGQPLETSLPHRRCTQRAPSVHPRYPPWVFRHTHTPLAAWQGRLFSCKQVYKQGKQVPEKWEQFCCNYGDVRYRKGKSA